MDKNYYEILEIDKKASIEIVDKAYKTLVKKYHPDLQEGSKKLECEEKLKLINEAYEILSNPDKREIYNQEIEFQSQQNRRDKDRNTYKHENKYTDTNYQENISNNNADSYIKSNFVENNYRSYENFQPSYQNLDEKVRQARQKAEYEKQYYKQMNNAINKAYHDAYIQDLKNRGYKIKYKKTFKDYINGFLSLVIFAFIVIVLWQIPFIRNFFINMYEENKILHYLVDLILKIFNM